MLSVVADRRWGALVCWRGTSTWQTDGEMARTRRTVTIAVDDAGRAIARHVPVVQVRVTDGVDRKKEVRISNDRFSIGTGETCQVLLSDPTVSALHCELWFDDAGLRVRDLDSKNGVLIDGVRVFDAAVPSGAVLTLGRSVLKLKLENESHHAPLTPLAQLGGLVGTSLPMRVLSDHLRRAAGSRANVLISGEVGTGKELAAEALIASSDRRDRPVVVLDARAVADQLLESELFGHEAGAFTGALTARAGVFERANTGTVLLDEVAELSAAAQAMLLGVLQRGSFRRVGGIAEVKVDVRVIALTAQELPRLVNQRRFRSDLYYRLAGVEVRVPTLDERRSDIPFLVEHFLERRGAKGKLAPHALARLVGSAWPGNVRELENAIERMLSAVEPTSPVASPSAPPSLDVPYATQKQRVLESFERSYVGALLEASGGNVSAAARRGGLNRVHLHELINRLGLKGVV